MEIGVSSYSYSWYIGKGKLDNLSVIAKAAEMGFEAIEYTVLPGETTEERFALAAQIKAEVARCGIELSAFLRGTTVGYGDAKTAQRLQILKNTGYDGYVDIEFEGYEDCVEELAKGLAFYRSLS